MTNPIIYVQTIGSEFIAKISAVAEGKKAIG